MSSLLPALVHAAIRNEVDIDEMAASATVLRALSAEHPTEITSALRAAQEQGVDLTQVGTLALFTDLRQVADILAKAFDLRIEDYRTTGAEMGIDAREAYPLLAALAYSRDEDMQTRALAWGADPHARWTVRRVMGQYDDARATIDWLTENIRSLNVDSVKQLLAASPPRPDVNSQRRCLRALSQAHIRKTRYFIEPLRELIELFAPGGPHALTLTPWELPYAGSNFAVVRSSLSQEANTAHELGLAQRAFDGWIRTTVPTHGTPYLDILNYQLMRPKEDVLRLPEWCVQTLSPAQAQDLLGVAFLKAIPLWLSRISFMSVNVAAPSPYVTDALGGELSPLRALTKIATSQPAMTSFTGPLYVLGRMDRNDFLKMGIAGLDALAVHCPVFAGPQGQPGYPDLAQNELIDARALMLRYHELSKQGPAGTPPPVELAVVRAQMTAFHEQCVREANTAPALAPARSGMRL